MYVFDEDKGREQGQQDWVSKKKPLYIQDPKKPYLYLQLDKDGQYKAGGYMTENAYAAGYIHQQWYCQKVEQKEQKKGTLGAILEEAQQVAERIQQDQDIDLRKAPYHLDGVIPAYPKHLTPVLTVFRQMENLQDGYDDGKKAHLNGHHCVYMIDRQQKVWERPFDESKWVPCEKPFIYVKGFLAGWNGKKKPDRILRASIQEGMTTPQPTVDNLVAERVFGFNDGYKARENFGSLTSVRPPYIFKNKRLFAYVTKNDWQTYYAPVENPSEFAYATAFLKSWKKWERLNLKDHAKGQTKPVRKTRSMRQYGLPFQNREHD